MKMRVIARLGVLFAVLCLSAQPSNRAGPAVKRAWEWDDGDRIVARLDKAAARERLRRHAQQWQSNRTGVGSAAVPTEPFDVIDGSDEPHLFLPWELFDAMMRMAFADDALTREAYRSTKEDQRQRLGLPEDMWERLESIAAAYRNDRRLERENAFSSLPKSSRDEEAVRIGELLCRDRYAALVEADRQFGPAFKRFLYTAVASSLSSLEILEPDAATLESVNRGCQ